MSCTVMYQPYAMSYSASSCDRTNNDKKSFKFPHAPSPPESTHSNASSAYSSPGSTGGSGSVGLGSSHNALLSSLSLLPPHIHSPSSVLASAAVGSSHSSNGAGGGGQRRPLTPSCAGSSSSSSASATITSASQLHSHSHHNNPHHSTSHHPHGAHNLHSHHQRSSSSSATSTSASYPHNLSASASATATSSSRDLSHSNSTSSSSTSSSNSSHHHNQSGGGRAQSSQQQQQQQQVGECSDDDSQNDPPQQHHQRGGGGDHHEREEGDGGENSRAQYLSANCILYVNYDGNTSRVVEEHFHKALSANPKSLPMSTRNFPPSFWNSNYQPPPSAKAASALASYGAADFYGTAMDYSAAASISAGFPHHHPHAASADPWHYPLGTHHHHQSYHHHHHRPADITYPPMSSTSRFNAAQYGSFLFPSTSAAASRFPGIPTAAQCSAVKGDAATAAHVGHHWAAAAAGAARYDGWSDLHLAADYSAAAAAHYSNMTAAAGKAGLDFESNYLQSS